MGNVRTRIAESLDEMRVLDAEIAAWHARWDESYAVRKHRTQLDLLVGLTRKLIEVLVHGASEIDLTRDAETVYAECRQADERLHYVRKLWRYYADKLDQRSGAADDQITRTLRAADEVIWSCWKTALKNLGAAPEFYVPAPLAYLSPQFAASTTHRAVYPSDLRPDLHKVFADHVRQLSIPVIALPPGCQRRPWWLVVAAHEVGHHVQWTLKLEDATKKAINGKLGDGRARRWVNWHPELFADACAVLLAGPAFIWAIAELETRPAPPPGKIQFSQYPPPVLRLAVARAVAELAGIEEPQHSPINGGVAGPASHASDGDQELSELAYCVPAVAEALLELTHDSGRNLRTLGAATARAYNQGIISYWQGALLSPRKPIPEQDLSAARFCTAGSVAAWQALAVREGTDLQLANWTASLAEQVLGVLPDCAEPGTRGGSPRMDLAARASDLAERFAADLYAIDLITDDQFAGGDGQP